MNEMTLSGMIRLGTSVFVEEDAEWFIVKVKVYDSEPEIIINPKANFDSKLHYFSKAYNEDLTLKGNSNIKIIDFDFVEAIEGYI